MKSVKTFAQLGINDNLLTALATLGYEQPSPVQAQSIPALLQGKDVLAQAQTGTGKTAAFALPVLHNLRLNDVRPQVLVLAPTRELAIQVAEAFQGYAKHIAGFHVLPIYGGQDYQAQLKALKRGVHVVVGTPGRVMDHLRRGTLKTDKLATIVLDEADEMLRMGFLEDVEWVLEQIKHPHQTVLFSATMPESIRRVTQRFLKQPIKIHIEPTVATVTSIEQYYMLVSRQNKLEALTRYFEVEDIDAALIFTGTKTFSVEVAEKLAARGYAATALNGDMSQGLREQVIAKLKRGTLDIVVATEVAARGLDIERISHVINYDIPYDEQSYIHRIGRTGRAGRTGKALLFVSPREKRLLQAIERVVGKKITAIDPPSASQVQIKRAEKFRFEVLQTLATEDISRYRELVEGIALKSEYSELDIAAAVAYLMQKDKALSLKDYEKVEFEQAKPARHRRGSPRIKQKIFSEKGRLGNKRRDAEGRKKPKMDKKKPSQKTGGLARKKSTYKKSRG